MQGRFDRPLPKSAAEIARMDAAAVAMCQTHFAQFEFRRCTIEYDAETDTTYAAVYVVADTWVDGSWYGHITLAKVKGDVELRPPAWRQ